MLLKKLNSLQPLDKTCHMTNHFKDKLDTAEGRVAGVSRKAGDASQKVKAKIIAAIKNFAGEYKLSIKDVSTLNAFAKISDAQNASLAWLVAELQKQYGLPKSEVFRHPQVSRKNETEAQSAKW